MVIPLSKKILGVTFSRDDFIEITLAEENKLSNQWIITKQEKLGLDNNNYTIYATNKSKYKSVFNDVRSPFIILVRQILNNKEIVVRYEPIDESIFGDVSKETLIDELNQGKYVFFTFLQTQVDESLKSNLTKNNLSQLHSVETDYKPESSSPQLVWLGKKGKLTWQGQDLSLGKKGYKFLKIIQTNSDKNIKDQWCAEYKALDLSSTVIQSKSWVKKYKNIQNQKAENDQEKNEKSRKLERANKEIVNARHDELIKSINRNKKIYIWQERFINNTKEKKYIVDFSN